jgi:hypothetical protein
MLFLYQKGSNISVTSFILLRFILEVPTHCPVIMYEFVIETKNNDKTFKLTDLIPFIFEFT